MENVKAINEDWLIIKNKAHIFFKSIWYDIYFKIEFAKFLHNMG